jgi:hypothetical protein
MIAKLHNAILNRGAAGLPLNDVLRSYPILRIHVRPARSILSNGLKLRGVLSIAAIT